MKKNSITFVLPGAVVAGGVISTTCLGNALLKRGCTVKIMFQNDDNSLFKIIKSGIKRHLLAERYYGLYNFGGEVKTFKDFNEVNLKQDEIIVGMGMMGSNIVGKSEHHNQKIQYLHGPHLDNMQLTNETINMDLPKIVVSEHLVKNVKTHNSRVLGVVPNGVDPTVFYHDKKFDKDGIGMIYSLHPSKDPITTVNAVRKICECLPKVPIYIFGVPGKFPVKKNVKYYKLPREKRKREIFSRSKVWIVASKYEGFSLPVLEAMSSSCVVVSTRCGGPDRFLTDGKDGYLVDVQDAEAIANKAIEVFNNEEKLEYLTTNVQLTVKNYTWEKSADSFLKAIEGL